VEEEVEKLQSKKAAKEAMATIEKSLYGIV
jgi:hypothetical protein